LYSIVILLFLNYYYLVADPTSPGSNTYYSNIAENNGNNLQTDNYSPAVKYQVAANTNDINAISPYANIYPMCTSSSCLVTNTGTDPCISINQQSLLINTGAILSSSGKYCVVQDLIWNNPTIPAITINSNNIIIDMQYHTLDLQSLGLSGIIISSQLNNSKIFHGSIINSKLPTTIPSNELNYMSFDPIDSTGYCIGIYSLVSNVLIEDITTNNCFIGIGNIGNVSHITISKSRMINFGFDYNGNHDYRGFGFLFSSVNFGLSNSITIQDSSAHSSTGQYSFAVRSVTNSLFENIEGSIGWNIPGPPISGPEVSMIFCMVASQYTTIKNYKARGGRAGISIINSIGK
jgi:hypothetical protein